MSDHLVPGALGCPELAVLWQRDGEDTWLVVGLYDDAGMAADESLRPRPAMEPGRAVVATLTPLKLGRSSERDPLGERMWQSRLIVLRETDPAWAALFDDRGIMCESTNRAGAASTAPLTAQEDES